MKTYTPVDNADWLEYRRPRLTSTELAGLHLTKSARAWQELRHKKERDPRSVETRPMHHGTNREPVLAPLVQDVDTRLIYNADPQTIIINADDERLCGTPDLYSEDGQVIGEIKTSSHPFEGGRYHDWAPDRYYLQCQANMLHTGAEACVLLVEYYTRDDAQWNDKFGVYASVKSTEYQVILPDCEVMDAMLQTAAEWFAWLDGTTPDWMGEVDSLDALDALADVVLMLADAEAKAKTWGELVKQYKSDIERLTGGSYAGEVAGYKLSVTKTAASTRLDSAALKKAEPEIYKQYQKETAGHTRITLKKET